jgi:hypothetical protein
MRALILLAVSTAGCAVAPKLLEWPDGSRRMLCADAPVTVFDLFTDARFSAQLRTAAEAWNDWARLPLFSISAGPPVVVGADAPVVFVVEHELPDPDWNGYARFGNPASRGGCSRNVIVGLSPKTRALTDRQIAAILAHELGHALGLAHVKLDDELMWPHVHQSNVVLFRIPAPGEEQLKWVRETWR